MLTMSTAELDILSTLEAVEALEGEAHRLFDDANSNLAFGNLTREQRLAYVQQTYRATEMHAQAMDYVRRLQTQIRYGT